MGKHLVSALLETEKHEITAITRPESKSTFPPQVKVARAGYDDHAALVSALRGQHVLIITLSVLAADDTEGKLIDAAAEAEVPYIMPNNWGGDAAHQSMRDAFIGAKYEATQRRLESLDKTSWIEIASGFWYEFSLAGTIDRYGFDFKDRKVRFYDEGTARMNTSTWEQIGRAVARLLSLKETRSSPDDNEPCLSDFKNRLLYVSSFFISQKDMFASVLRVTGTKESDWDITYEKSADRYKSGLEEMQNGTRWLGFMQVLYSRCFFPEEADGDSAAAFEKRHKLINDILGLPKEDLDERTKVAIEMGSGLLSESYQGIIKKPSQG